MKSFDVYLFDGNLYVHENMHDPFGGVVVKMRALYHYTKDKDLVDDVKNLKADFDITSEELYKADAEKIGFLHFHERHGYSFSYMQGKRNPFKQQLCNKLENAFVLDDPIHASQTVIPFDSVIFYSVQYEFGLISSIVLHTKSGVKVTISNLGHNEYFEILNKFNEAKLC